MLGSGEGVLAGDVEFVKADVVEEHIDSAQVVGGDIGFPAHRKPLRTPSCPSTFTAFSSREPEPQAGSVAVSNLIQHNGSLFLPLNDETTPRVHFCTPLITMPYAPLRSKGFGFIATLCVHCVLLVELKIISFPTILLSSNKLYVLFVEHPLTHKEHSLKCDGNEIHIFLHTL